MGAKTGIHAYFQSLSSLLLKGINVCTILGPRSRAGLIAYPVVPPKLSPIEKTTKATGSAPSDPRPTLLLPRYSYCNCGNEISNTANTKTNVPMNSEKKLFG